MQIHHVKSWPVFFRAVWRGEKTAELRRLDRPYTVGDLLVQHEFDPAHQAFTGNVIAARITDITSGTEHLMPGFGMLSLGGLMCFTSAYNPAPTDDAAWQYLYRKGTPHA